MGWITQHMDIQKFGHISTPPHAILVSEGISDISTFFKGRKISKAILFDFNSSKKFRKKTSAAKWIPDRPIHYLIKPKDDNRLSVDLDEFPRFYLNLPIVNLKFTKQCFVHTRYIKVSSGKNREIQLNQQTNKQTFVKCRLDNLKYGAVSYLLSCTGVLAEMVQIKNK